MFFIVVEVFGLERVRFESRPLLHVEIVVLYVGFHAVFGHEAVILFGAIDVYKRQAIISNINSNYSNFIISANWTK